MAYLPNILQFTSLTQRFAKVRRHNLYPGMRRQETDPEHSFQLAMLAWYIVDSQKLALDKDLVIKYALVHDLVEIHSGDTFIYSADKALLNSQAEREQAAAARLRAEFPEFAELHALVREYEQRLNKESKFVYALDKVVPILNNYLDNGRTWKKNGVTLQMLIDAKQAKVAVSPEVAGYFSELVALLKKEEAELFQR